MKLATIFSAALLATALSAVAQVPPQPVDPELDRDHRSQRELAEQRLEAARQRCLSQDEWEQQSCLDRAQLDYDEEIRRLEEDRRLAWS